jgi:hypothetical protein
LLTVKANPKTPHRQIRSQFQGKRKIPFVAGDHEIGHGRNITWTLQAKQAPEQIREAWVSTSWIVKVTATGRSDSKPFQGATCSSPACAPRQKHCCNGCVTDGAFKVGTGFVTPSSVEDAHRYRDNRACMMATLRKAALNLLRQAGFRSIRTGLQTLMHEIKALLVMARRQAGSATC